MMDKSVLVYVNVNVNMFFGPTSDHKAKATYLLVYNVVS